MKMPGPSDEEIQAWLSGPGGKRVSIRFTPERQHSLDFGKLAA